MACDTGRYCVAVIVDARILCLVYAAKKSTEDRRGSIPDQLRECRTAIELEPGRSVVAEYSDEAVSA